MIRRFRRPLAGAVLVLFAGCTGKYIRPTTDTKVELTPERLKRGEYLVRTIGACGSCHDGRENGDLVNPPKQDEHLAGGNFLRDGALGIFVPNITNEAETGIGLWTDDELIRGIRDGVKKDGSFMIPLMPFEAYARMSDEDVKAIVAYLRSAPAVKQQRPDQEHDVPFMMKATLNMGVAMHEPVVSVPEPDRSDKVKYGEYLAYLGHCTTCHSMGKMGARKPDDRWMAGGDSPMELPGVGKVWASNLTPAKETGLGRFSDEQVKMAMMSGVRTDGKRMAPPMTIYVPHIASMDPGDVDALVAYLRSLPPVENKVPARELTPEMEAIVGK